MSPLLPDSDTPTAAAAPAESRVVFIDGIRGLTALLIVLTHVYWEICPEGDGAGLPRLVAAALHPFAYANKVGIFIVISGFGLARAALLAGKREGSRQPVLRGGTVNFLRRRARRILPPYYAALALSLLMIETLPALHAPHGVRWDVALPPNGFRGTVLSHLLLLHNLHPNWSHRIDPPMWSLGIEWQMYFLFAFVLLPLWRRFGVVATIGLGFVLGFLPHFVLQPDWNYDWTSPWYIALFCLGLAAATILESGDPRTVCREARAGMILSGLAVATTIWQGVAWINNDRRPFVDLVVGFFVSCVLLYGSAAHRLGWPSRLTRLLGSRIPTFLGRFSYSLYLIHFPLLSLFHAFLRTHLPNHRLGLTLQLAILYLLGVPICLAVAYGFHCLLARLRPPSSPLP